MSTTKTENNMWQRDKKWDTSYWSLFNSTLLMCCYIEVSHTWAPGWKRGNQGPMEYTKVQWRVIIFHWTLVETRHAPPTYYLPTYYLPTYLSIYLPLPQLARVQPWRGSLWSFSCCCSLLRLPVGRCLIRALLRALPSLLVPLSCRAPSLHHFSTILSVLE